MRKVLLITALMLYSAVLSAQREVGSFSFKPKAGLSVSNVTHSDATGPRYGLVAGGEFEYQAFGYISFSAGALYSMQGAISKDVYGFGMKTNALKLDYLNFPILMNVTFARGFAVRFGVQPGVRVNNTLTVKDKIGATSYSYYGLRLFDMSLPVGLSFETQRLVFDLMMSSGLINIYPNTDSRNVAVQLSVGYRLDL